MMKILPILTLLTLSCPLHGQLVGAYETFTEQENANSWKFYDYFVGGESIAPMWKRPGSEADPEIYAQFTQDYGVSLYADAGSSDGYLVGNYTDQGVAGVFCNIYVEDQASLDSFEFYFVSDGTFYYSNYFEVDSPGWSSAENSFKDSDWYVGVDNDDDGFLDGYDYIALTDEILSTVSEIGLNFFPLSNAADGKDVGIDNFTLVADLTPVAPVLTVFSGSGSYSFQGLPGIEYTVEESSSLAPTGWAPVAAPFEGNGPYAHNFPIALKKFLRVVTSPLYTEIPKVGS